MQAERDGMKFLCRTAASFVASRAGLPPRPLLNLDGGGSGNSSGDHNSSNSSSSEQRVQPGGLIVVGSYVPKTTAQLTCLLEECDVDGIEIDAAAVIAAHREGQQQTVCVYVCMFV